ncbi:MAG: SNF2-related protein, partial [Bacteriovoracaceae bacterium]|nr:SNF2-related protein [Bacteriovoracaceae bacterium]
MSETEPELGLGMIAQVEAKTVQILFLASGEKRTYGTKGAPLKRVVFSVGDEVTLRNGEKFIVKNYEIQNNLIHYLTEENANVDERELSDAISFNKPEERLFNGESDSMDLFELRYRTYQVQKAWKTSKARGFIGGRLALLPHQLYVASTVAKRSHPRVLLADEVGLGKTIEAGLIIHQMLTTERVERVLIIVPDSLVYQWFVEMLRKFNLTFTTINQETPLEMGVNPFKEKELIIVNIGL